MLFLFDFCVCVAMCMVFLIVLADMLLYTKAFFFLYKSLLCLLDLLSVLYF